MEDGLHISISAEPLTEVGGFVVTNALLSSVIISVVLIGFALAVRLNLTDSKRPRGLQNVAEWIVESLYNLTHSVTNNRAKTNAFFPLIAGFFLFILVNNWVSVLPGVGTIGLRRPAAELHAGAGAVQTKPAPPDRPQFGVVYAAEAGGPEETGTLEGAAVGGGAAAEGNPEGTAAENAGSAHGDDETVFVPLFRAASADLNFTLALALLSVGLTQLFGIKYAGLGYFKKFINFSNPIMFFVGILETISEIAKIISFAFRLFGNIFAGEVLLAVTLFLAPIIVPLPFYGLEVFVGFIQALVFTMLSLVFFNMATISLDH